MVDTDELRVKELALRDVSEVRIVADVVFELREADTAFELRDADTAFEVREAEATFEVREVDAALERTAAVF